MNLKDLTYAELKALTLQRGIEVERLQKRISRQRIANAEYRKVMRDSQKGIEDVKKEIMRLRAIVDRNIKLMDTLKLGVRIIGKPVEEWSIHDPAILVKGPGEG